MSLTDTEIRSLKGGEKTYKRTDSAGLQLWVYPNGSRIWRVAYRFNGKQKTYTIGDYPTVSLSQARQEPNKVKRMLLEGKDPSAVKQASKTARLTASANTFKTIAAELVEMKRREGKAEATLQKMEWYFVLSDRFIGQRPIAEIKSAEILEILKWLESRRTLETARKVRSALGQVFRYAIATSRAEYDPTAALRGAIAAPTVKHRAAIIDPVEFGHLLRALPEYTGATETVAALMMIPLVFVRPGELRAAEWAEFDLERAVWLIPAAKMKMRQPHRIPLAAQTLAILRDLKTLTGDGKYLFPSIRTRTRCMSENTINAALRRLGFNSEVMTGHGFRSSASSLLNESGQFKPDAIERQLAHLDDNKIRRIYHRTDYWEDRVTMMAWWADRCDELRNAAEASASALAMA
jgi:integrase